MEVLRAEGLKKIYGTGAGKVEALRSIDLSIESGEMVAVIGPSGSGKTTLLHALGGIQKPTKGRVLVEGKDIYSLSANRLAIFRRRQVGIVYQYYNLLPVLNVEENILMPVFLDGKPINQGRLEELLDILNIETKRNLFPSELSGGQLQRTAIARALINSPTILLADEPTGNLDSKNSQQIMELFKKTNRKYGQTLIIITHDEDIALQADRIITMDDGVIISDSLVTGKGKIYK